MHRGRVQSERRAERCRTTCLVEFRGLGANVGRISRVLGVAWPAFGVAWPIGAQTASREPESEWFQVFGVNVGRISHGSRSRSQNVPAAPNGEKRTITRLVRGGVAGSSSEKAP